MSKEKQIEEMAKAICEVCKCDGDCDATICSSAFVEAEHLYNAGYRKQSVGEWKIAVNPVEATFICSKCGYFYIEADPQAETEYKFCPECGAKMKGE